MYITYTNIIPIYTIDFQCTSRSLPPRSPHGFVQPRHQKAPSGRPTSRRWFPRCARSEATWGCSIQLREPRDQAPCHSSWGSHGESLGKPWEDPWRSCFLLDDFCEHIWEKTMRNPWTSGRKTMEKNEKTWVFLGIYSALGLREDLLETVFGDFLGDVPDVPFNQFGDPLDL